MLLLDEDSSEGKPPALMTIAEKGKLASQMLYDSSEANIAKILTDGCNMGIKQLSEYRNKYKNASPAAKNAADSLIVLQENFSVSLRPFL